MLASVTNININLFRYGMEERVKDDIFPAAGLPPLREFKSLKTLSLCGMLDSYQRQVWETVWSFPGLKHLDLRMALEPEHRDPGVQIWPIIRKKDWQMQKFSDIKANYW